MVGRYVSIGIFAILPWLFKFHVLMPSALVLNLALLFGGRRLCRLFI